MAAKTFVNETTKMPVLTLARSKNKIWRNDNMNLIKKDEATQALTRFVGNSFEFQQLNKTIENLATIEDLTTTISIRKRMVKKCLE